MFTTILKAIGAFFSKLLGSPDGRTFLVAVIAVILGILLLRSCNDLNNEKRTSKQNQAAADTAMQIAKNKDNQLSYQKAAYEGTVSDLKKKNDSLYKAYQAEKGSVKIISIVKPRINEPLISLDNQLVIINDTLRGLKFSKTTPLRSIEGMTTFGFTRTLKKDSLFYRLSAGTTTISKDETSIELVTGLKEDKGVYSIFVTPKTPGVTITNIEGAIIDKSTLFGSNTSPLATPISTKRGGLGFNIGLGMMPAIYDGGVHIVFGPTLSIGYNYNVVRF